MTRYDKYRLIFNQRSKVFFNCNIKIVLLKSNNLMNIEPLSLSISHTLSTFHFNHRKFAITPKANRTYFSRNHHFLSTRLTWFYCLFFIIYYGSNCISLTVDNNYINCWLLLPKPKLKWKRKTQSLHVSTRWVPITELTISQKWI